MVHLFDSLDHVSFFLREPAMKKLVSNFEQPIGLKIHSLNAVDVRGLLIS